MKDKTERSRIGFLRWCQFEGCERVHVGFGKCQDHYGYPDLASYEARRATKRPRRRISRQKVSSSAR
jgi:hypothetical protein